MNVYTGFPKRNVNCLAESDTMRGHSAIEPADGTQDTGNMSGLSCRLVVCLPSPKKAFQGPYFLFVFYDVGYDGNRSQSCFMAAPSLHGQVPIDVGIFRVRTWCEGLQEKELSS